MNAHVIRDYRPTSLPKSTDIHKHVNLIGIPENLRKKYFILYFILKSMRDDSDERTLSSTMVTAAAETCDERLPW